MLGGKINNDPLLVDRIHQFFSIANISLDKVMRERSTLLPVDNLKIHTISIETLANARPDKTTTTNYIYAHESRLPIGC
jgi:hypothetical protein